MYFSIAAPQNVTLPDGQVLSFRVNAQDSSLVEIHIIGADGNDVPGTHILTFKRNGSPSDTQFVAAPKQDQQPAYKTSAEPDEDIPGTPVPVPPVPYADSPSVDQDAVRANSWPANKGLDRTAAPIGKVNTSDQINRGYKTPGDNKPAA